MTRNSHFLVLTHIHCSAHRAQHSRRLLIQRAPYNDEEDMKCPTQQGLRKWFGHALSYLTKLDWSAHSTTENGLVCSDAPPVCFAISTNNGSNHTLHTKSGCPTTDEARKTVETQYWTNLIWRHCHRQDGVLLLFFDHLSAVFQHYNKNIFLKVEIGKRPNFPNCSRSYTYLYLYLYETSVKYSVILCEASSPD